MYPSMYSTFWPSHVLLGLFKQRGVIRRRKSEPWAVRSQVEPSTTIALAALGLPEKVPSPSETAIQGGCSSHRGSSQLEWTSHRLYTTNCDVHNTLSVNQDTSQSLYTSPHTVPRPVSTQKSVGPTKALQCSCHPAARTLCS